MTEGRPQTAPERRHRDSARRRAELGLRVLVVEDDEQVATVLSTLLESEGYEVAAAATAEEGLLRLANAPFHLLITDYWLPDRTGAWMLNEASQKGYLRGSQVMVITAEHRPQGVENLLVLRKPLDLDDFLRHVQDVLAPVRKEALERAKEEVARKVKDGGDGSTPLVELTLYISASSPTSLKALRNLQRLLVQYDAARIRLTICDLSREHPATADEDRIAFTPTLVKRNPGPKVWVLGDLENADIVGDLLAHSGLERGR